MGFTKEQSSNALILHGTVEKALEALSGIPGMIMHLHISQMQLPRHLIYSQSDFLEHSLFLEFSFNKYILVFVSSYLHL